MKSLSVYIAIFILSATNDVFAQKRHEEHRCCRSRKEFAEHFFVYRPEKCADYPSNVIYQRLNLEIDPNIFGIKGNVFCVFYKQNENTAKVAFDLSNSLTTDSVISNGRKLEFSHSNNILSIGLDENNIVDSVCIFYHGAPSSTGFGSFRKASHAGYPIIWTLSEPYGASDWFPCKETLDDKIDSIDLVLITPPDTKAASVGLRISETFANGKKRTHWKHRYPIAQYLVAFSVTNYAEYSEYLNSPVFKDSLHILNCVYPENLDYAKSGTIKLLPVIQLFNELFGNYPFEKEKYGHAQFGWGGGMEHQTMSFVSHFNLNLMTHELAHQWFGDDITCGSWQDIWLNEGFATYAEGLIIEHGLNDDNNDFFNWRKGKINNILQKSGGSVFVYDTSTVQKIFDTRLTYNKAALVLHMLRRKIGDEAFFSAIKSYRNDTLLSGSFAKTKDFRRHTETACGCDLEDFFEQWIYGEGYPIYAVQQHNIDNNTFSLSVFQKSSVGDNSFFPANICIKLSGFEKDSLLYFDHQFSGQTFFIESAFDVLKIEFDPFFDIVTPRTLVRFDIQSEADKIILVPNPTKNIISACFKEQIKIETVSIINTQGTRVFAENIHRNINQYDFDLSLFPEGTYFLQFRTGRHIISKKMVKQ